MEKQKILDRLKAKYGASSKEKQDALYGDIEDVFAAYPSLSAISLVYYTNWGWSDGDVNTPTFCVWVDGLGRSRILALDGEVYNLEDGDLEDVDLDKLGLDLEPRDKEEAKEATKLLTSFKNAISAISNTLAIRADRLPDGKIKFIKTTDYCPEH